jgi:hypothetical protein
MEATNLQPISSETTSLDNWFARKDFNKFTILKVGTESPRIGLAHKEVHARFFAASPTMYKALLSGLKLIELGDGDKDTVISEFKKALDLANGKTKQDSSA